MDIWCDWIRLDKLIQFCYIFKVLNWTYYSYHSQVSEHICPSSPSPARLHLHPSSIRHCCPSMQWWSLHHMPPPWFAGEMQTALERYRPAVQRTGLATSGDAGTLQISRGSLTGAWQLQATQALSHSRGSPTGCKNHISLLSKQNKNKCIWCKYAKMHNKNQKRKIIPIFW